MLKCSACPRVGDDIGTCGSPVTCPGLAGAIEMDATKGDILVRCPPCDIVRAVNVRDIAHRFPTDLAHSCPQTDCKCVTLAIPTPKPAKGTTVKAPPVNEA